MITQQQMDILDALHPVNHEWSWVSTATAKNTFQACNFILLSSQTKTSSHKQQRAVTHLWRDALILEVNTFPQRRMSTDTPPLFAHQRHLAERRCVQVGEDTEQSNTSTASFLAPLRLPCAFRIRHIGAAVCRATIIHLFIYWRLIAQSTAQGHLRAFHKFKSHTSWIQHKTYTL